MKTHAVRLYGKQDLRLEQFELPPIGNDEILARLVSDSICTSSYKAFQQGGTHIRIPDNVAQEPIIIGHEFCGEVLEVGSKWQSAWHPGQRFTIQPALNYQGSLAAPGYSYPHIGGSATYIVIPNEVMEMDCLLEYKGDAFFRGSLAEPYSCVIAAMSSNYHIPEGTHQHVMGVEPAPGGRSLIIGGTGPMGTAMVDLALHGDRRPGLLVVTGMSDPSGKPFHPPFSVEDAAAHGVELHYLIVDDASELRKQITARAKDFHDIFLMVAMSELVEMSDQLLARDGCLNFFAGPSDPNFSATINFYAQHYAFHHYTAISGGTTDDIRRSLQYFEAGSLYPERLVSHIGGLNAVSDTIGRLPEIGGTKKLIYNHIDLPLTALSSLPELAEESKLHAGLADCVERAGGWSAEAEEYLLKHAPPLC